MLLMVGTKEITRSRVRVDPIDISSTADQIHSLLGSSRYRETGALQKSLSSLQQDTSSSMAVMQRLSRASAAIASEGVQLLNSSDLHASLESMHTHAAGLSSLGDSLAVVQQVVQQMQEKFSLLSSVKEQIEVFLSDARILAEFLSKDADTFTYVFLHGKAQLDHAMQMIAPYKNMSVDTSMSLPQASSLFTVPSFHPRSWLHLENTSLLSDSFPGSWDPQKTLKLCQEHIDQHFDSEKETEHMDGPYSQAQGKLHAKIAALQEKALSDFHTALFSNTEHAGIFSGFFSSKLSFLDETRNLSAQLGEDIVSFSSQQQEACAILDQHIGYVQKLYASLASLLSMLDDFLARFANSVSQLQHDLVPARSYAQNTSHSVTGVIGTAKDMLAHNDRFIALKEMISKIVSHLIDEETAVTFEAGVAVLLPPSFFERTLGISKHVAEKMAAVISKEIHEQWDQYYLRIRHDLTRQVREQIISSLPENFLALLQDLDASVKKN